MMKLSEKMIHAYGVGTINVLADSFISDTQKLEQENETLKKELMQIANGGYTGASHIAMVALGLVKS